ncbi:glutathione S-transferase 3-like isoform X2 [Lepidochelys kempii]|uniref:glutathione S-transferase 3-like isoform X2 n=1 Tax=Lepidochelys kempii TaxID=8472 RepID=UPI003C6F8B89
MYMAEGHCWHMMAYITLVDVQEIQIMATKPKLYYFNGRGQMETIRWLLETAGVEFEEAEYLETRKQYEKLIQAGFLLFHQVPLVEIDEMKLVESRAILNYIAGKHNLCGKDLRERALYCNRLYQNIL